MQSTLGRGAGRHRLGVALVAMVSLHIASHYRKLLVCLRSLQASTMMRYTDPVPDDARLEPTPSVVRKKPFCLRDAFAQVVQALRRLLKAGTQRTIERTRRAVQPKGSVNNGN
jgi:hypothetical protein